MNKDNQPLNKNKKQAINGLAVLFKLYIERKG
jgi:hypothetical protein